jgi:putative membrane protein
MKKNNLHKFGVCLLLAPLAAFVQSVSGASASAGAPTLTDANIAAIVVAANDIDIKAGKLAQKTTTNADVKGLGDMMVRDHEAVNQQAKDLVTKLHVSPQANDLSKQLKADADKTYDGLKAKKGADFDQAYVANEIAYHEAVISVVETMLIPGAQNAELKTLLQHVLPALQAHLAHAKHVQAQLK